MTPRDTRIEELERRVQALEDTMAKSAMRFPTEEERRQIMEEMMKDRLDQQAWDLAGD